MNWGAWTLPSKMDKKLSKREIEIVDVIRLGMSNKMIGKLLKISPTTVKTHIENICRKLNVNNRTQIALKGPESNMKPFAYFDRNTGALRFETLRDMRNARLGEQREIPLFTNEEVDGMAREIRRLERALDKERSKALNGAELQ